MIWNSLANFLCHTYCVVTREIQEISILSRNKFLKAFTFFFFFFFFKDPATPEFYPLSLPDPLPISHPAVPGNPAGDVGPADRDQSLGRGAADPRGAAADGRRAGRQDRQHLERCRPRRQHGRDRRSEEHTSELQSPCNLVCRLLLEKK